ncbi:porin [Bibersteinia trehalosi]|uniref:porin n=1 Tax=Bibersteinia trehalosi TaxID=47735 RepID=UPI003D2E4F5E
MKKTLVALAVTAFAASASAVTVYENEGTKVDFEGSLRLVLEKSHSKVDGQSSKKGHSALRNAGSRMAIKAKHELDSGLYALSRLELRFDGHTSSSDKFGDIYAKRAYVGLGHKDFGEVTFGRQLTIGDDIGETGFDYVYGISPDLLTDAGNAVVRYDYFGIEGLQLGVNYNFGTDRYTKDDEEKGLGTENELKPGKVKNGYGAGAVYTFPVAEGQKVTLEAGYTRDNYTTGTKQKHYKDAWEVAASYTIDNVKLAIDGSQAYEKDQGAKIRTSMINVAAKYTFSDIGVGIYGGYGYEHEKVRGDSDKTRKHKYLIGTDYRLHKQVVTFAEARIVSNRSDNETKRTDSNFGVGMRVFW